MTAHLQAGLVSGDRPAELQRDAAGQRPASLSLPASSLASPLPLPASGARRWSSRELLGMAKEVEIEHEGMVYRLRQTALGKLILTK
ncbi:hemin uptake protein HemP [Sphaerotilus microaerophilus]|nr:hemin uptake protein HemP [Sphaerotilus sp. FB-5]